MSSPEKAEGSDRRRAPKTATNQAAKSYPSELTLWAYSVPAHPLAPPEAHLRLVANVRPERSHWWIRMIREHQAECRQCRRCDGEAAA